MTFKITFKIIFKKPQKICIKSAYAHTCSSSHFSNYSPWMLVNINPQCKIFTKSLILVVMYLLIPGIRPFVTPLLAV
jgi:hypothetical protein